MIEVRWVHKCAGRWRTRAGARVPPERMPIIFSRIFTRAAISGEIRVPFSFYNQLARERERERRSGRGRGKKEDRYRMARGYSYELLSWWCGGRQFAFPVQRISFGVLGSFPKQTKTGRLNGHRIATAAPNHRKRERNTNSTGTSARCLHTSYGGSF